MKSRLRMALAIICLCMSLIPGKGFGQTSSDTSASQEDVVSEDSHSNVDINYPFVDIVKFLPTSQFGGVIRISCSVTPGQSIVMNARLKSTDKHVFWHMVPFDSFFEQRKVTEEPYRHLLEGTKPDQLSRAELLPESETFSRLLGEGYYSARFETKVPDTLVNNRVVIEIFVSNLSKASFHITLRETTTPEAIQMLKRQIITPIGFDLGLSGNNYSEEKAKKDYLPLLRLANKLKFEVQPPKTFLPLTTVSGALNSDGIGGTAIALMIKRGLIILMALFFIGALLISKSGSRRVPNRIGPGFGEDEPDNGEEKLMNITFFTKKKQGPLGPRIEELKKIEYPKPDDEDVPDPAKGFIIPQKIEFTTSTASIKTGGIVLTDDHFTSSTVTMTLGDIKPPPPPTPQPKRHLTPLPPEQHRLLEPPSDPSPTPA